VPALLIQISMLPSSSVAKSAKAATSLARATFAGRPQTLIDDDPAASAANSRSSSTAALTRSGSLEQIATLSPARINSAARDFPIPLVPPVTTTLNAAVQMNPLLLQRRFARVPVQ
jgi:hypothetical protein